MSETDIIANNSRQYEYLGKRTPLEQMPRLLVNVPYAVNFIVHTWSLPSTSALSR